MSVLGILFLQKRKKMSVFRQMLEQTVFCKILIFGDFLILAILAMVAVKAKKAKI